MTKKQNESILNDNTENSPRGLRSSPCMLPGIKGVYAGLCDEEAQLVQLQELLAAARERVTVTNTALTHTPDSKTLKLLEQVQRDELNRYSALIDTIQLLGGKASKQFGETSPALEQPEDLPESLRFLSQNQQAVVCSLNALLPRIPPGELFNVLKSMRDQHLDNFQYIDAIRANDKSGEDRVAK